MATSTTTTTATRVTTIDAGEAPKLAQHTKWAKSKSQRRAEKTRK